MCLFCTVCGNWHPKLRRAAALPLTACSFGEFCALAAPLCRRHTPKRSALSGSCPCWSGTRWAAAAATAAAAVLAAPPAVAYLLPALLLHNLRHEPPSTP